ncbi:Auxin-responsive protein [Arachis hypogaea]|nr:Auxin-responsive protein [Arachis hypogaea]
MYDLIVSLDSDAPRVLALVSEDEGQSKVSTVASASSQSLDCFSQSGGGGLKERNYLGLSDCSSVDSSNFVPSLSNEKKGNLNLKATELRLKLPGSR